jgi:ABC-2 type transport system permease protein
VTTMAGPVQRVTQLRVLRSEWTKLRSLQSTLWSMLATLLLIVGVGAGYSMIRVTRPPRPGAAGGFDPTAVSLTGVSLAQFAIGVLGVLMITGEYTTGQIRSTLAAVPWRLPVLWGKAVAIAVIGIGLCAPAVVAAFLVGQSILAGARLDTSFAAAGTVRAVAGSALYLTVVGLLGLGLGVLLRSTAAAISALFGLLFVPQLLLGLLPETWSDASYRYLPTPAGLAITEVRHDPISLAPWAGFGLFCGYAALVLALGAWRLWRQDA